MVVAWNTPDLRVLSISNATTSSGSPRILKLFLITSMRPSRGNSSRLRDEVARYSPSTKLRRSELFSGYRMPFRAVLGATPALSKSQQPWPIWLAWRAVTSLGICWLARMRESHNSSGDTIGSWTCWLSSTEVEGTNSRKSRVVRSTAKRIGRCLIAPGPESTRKLIVSISSGWTRSEPEKGDLLLCLTFLEQKTAWIFRLRDSHHCTILAVINDSVGDLVPPLLFVCCIATILSILISTKMFANAKCERRNIIIPIQRERSRRITYLELRLSRQFSLFSRIKPRLILRTIYSEGRSKKIW